MMANPMADPYKTLKAGGLGQGIEAPDVPGQAAAAAGAQPSSDISKHLADFTSSSSPVMQQARTSGRQQANQRGLLNSSMGIQAAEDAAYRVALPAASQMAGQGHETGLQGRAFAHDRTMQTDRFGHETGLQTRGFGHETDMEQMRQAHQTMIADKNIAAHDREKAAALAAAYSQAYSNSFAALASNPNIPADVRDKYLGHINATFQSNMAMVEQFYGIQLDWGSPSSPGVAPEAGSRPFAPDGPPVRAGIGGIVRRAPGAAGGGA